MNFVHAAAENRKGKKKNGEMPFIYNLHDPICSSSAATAKTVKKKGLLLLVSTKKSFA